MTKTVKMYGIKNCDTVRKAIKWLNSKDVDSEFFDLKKVALDDVLINEWLENVGQDKLINKRGLTWRKLAAEDKLLNNPEDVIRVIQNNPTVVKRPVLFNGRFWTVGFEPTSWDDLFL